MITKYFEDKLNQEIVPEVTNPEYSMWDDGGTEAEVGELLYGFIRTMRPDNVLETGTYHGISASYIAQALKDNEKGMLTTLEHERQHIKESKERIQKLDLSEHVQIHHMSSLEYKPEHNFQFILLDTEPNIRFAELEWFYPHLDQGGYIFIHDLPRNMCQGNKNPDHPDIKSWPFGEIPREMRKLITHGQLSVFHLPSPRGFVGFYKSHKDDYGHNFRYYTYV